MKLIRLISALGSAVFIAGSLSGCGALSLGEEEFSCTGMPGSVFCRSARDVYDITNEGIVPTPMKKDAYNEDCTDCVRSEDVNPELARIEAERRGEDAGWVTVTDKATGESRRVKRRTLNVNDDEVINNYVAPRLPSEPVPVRTPSQVMRIWVAPYVDTNGDLVAPGFVYTEIEPRRWIYPGDERAGNARMIAPLQAASPYPNRRMNGPTQMKPLN